MRKLSVAFVAAAALVSSSASAADLPYKAAPLLAAAYNWTGFYVGAHVGHLWGDTDNDTTFLPNGHASSLFFGVQGGYRFQLPNNMVIGVQVAVPLWSADENFNAAPFGGGTNTVEMKGSAVVQAILGVAMDRFLPYVTIGVGAARIHGVEVIGGVTTTDVTNTHTLFTAGLGLKYALTQNWQVGVGFNHVRASSEAYLVGRNFKFTGNSVALSIDYRI